MKTWISATGRVGVVAPAGEVDMPRAEQLRKALLGLLAEPGIRLVVVDLAAVTFMDSTGLGTIVGASRRAQRAGQRVLVVQPGEHPRRTLQLTGLGGMVTPPLQ